MLVFLVLTAVTFSLFGFVLGIWATSWEKLQFVPALIITPLTFLGGSFYSIDMLPPVWRDHHAVQPGGVPDQRLPLELHEIADVNVGTSLFMTGLFLVICVAIMHWIFRTGYHLKK